MVYLAGQFIHTKLFSKKSDTHCYLIPTSCHKNHIIRNIPSGVARRVRQNTSEDINFVEQRAVSTSHLLKRGYNIETVNKAFDNFTDIGKRKDLYQIKDKVVNMSGGLCPLVIDNNPALPPVGTIIHRHKSLLERDESLKKIIPPGSVFVSYRKNKSIRDMLIHNRFKSNTSIPSTVDPKTPLQPIVMEPSVLISTNGCVPCGKCYCCKLGYLSPCDSFSSFHTTQVFSINKRITCQDVGLIYLADCITCESSCVGYSILNIPKRFSNHRSHIRCNRKTCRLTCHFIEKDHNLVRDQTQKEFDDSLLKHLRIKLIDTVEFVRSLSNPEKEKLCESREGFWQHLLKSFKKFDGMNVLGSHQRSKCSV